MGTCAPRPIETRRQRLAGAIAFLKRRCILVDAVDREAVIRRYRVSGVRSPLLAEDVIDIAAALEFEVGNG